jgi:Conserved in the green lineage and diatoms 27
MLHLHVLMLLLLAFLMLLPSPLPPQDILTFSLRLLTVYAGAAGVSLPIAHVTFGGDNQVAQLLLAANIGALGVLTAVTLRLYSGWDYVGQRLSDVSANKRATATVHRKFLRG